MSDALLETLRDQNFSTPTCAGGTSLQLSDCSPFVRFSIFVLGSALIRMKNMMLAKWHQSILPPDGGNLFKAHLTGTS